MQGLGYGFTMPLWSIVHLLRSKTAQKPRRAVAKTIKITDLQSLETLPTALILGYFIPTLLMAGNVPS